MGSAGNQQQGCVPLFCTVICLLCSSSPAVLTKLSRPWSSQQGPCDQWSRARLCVLILGPSYLCYLGANCLTLLGLNSPRNRKRWLKSRDLSRCDVLGPFASLVGFLATRERGGDLDWENYNVALGVCRESFSCISSVGSLLSTRTHPKK